jgi:hypothetical protein
MYIGLFGATEPLDSALNSAPATGWTDVGATNGGISVTANLTIDQLTIDQTLDIPGDVITGRTVTIATTMSEATLVNYARTWNIDETSAITTGTSPVGGMFEPASDVTSFKPVYHAIILDGIAPGGFKRRVIARRVIQTGSPALNYAKSDQTGLAVAWRTTYVSPSIKPFRVIDGIA